MIIQPGVPKPGRFSGEPLFGYYQSADPWVLRKHAEMLRCWHRRHLMTPEGHQYATKELFEEWESVETGSES